MDLRPLTPQPAAASPSTSTRIHGCAGGEVCGRVGGQPWTISDGWHKDANKDLMNTVTADPDRAATGAVSAAVASK